jgi:hypothetical protein
MYASDSEKRLQLRYSIIVRVFIMDLITFACRMNSLDREIVFSRNTLPTFTKSGINSLMMIVMGRDLILK